MARSISYESTIAPASLQTLGTGPNAANLGKRNETGLANAFDEPSALDRGGEAELLRIARQKMAEYTGENPMFPQYRRDFVPAAAAGGTLTAEYAHVRDKNTVDLGVGTGLGSAYSPTIASPGAQNGINPTNLASISSSINGAVIADFDNPNNAVHQNVGDAIAGRVAPPGGPPPGATGQVRTFRLAVGSGGAGATNNSVATSVGQFPRPLT
jgi:hypothetical protein